MRAPVLVRLGITRKPAIRIADPVEIGNEFDGGDEETKKARLARGGL
jgi:hypothetical protein